MIKFNYYMKISIIILLSTLLLASVETAPDHPLNFLVFSGMCSIAIRRLWKVALNDEKKMKYKAIISKMRDRPHQSISQNRAA